MPTLPVRLNSQQQQAVEHIHGPLLVLAGAGSGKTRVITNKIAHLIQRGGVEPAKVAAVTFTNKAAREMQARSRQTLKGEGGARISTFHRLGLDILLAEASVLGFRKNLSILDSEDSAKLIRDLGVSEPDRIKLAQRWISNTKQALITPEQASASAQSDGDATLARLYGEYCSHIKGYNAVDFDDLIVLPTRLLEDNSEARERWQARIHYLLVDEYQDTNPVQYRMMRALVGARARFTVVGDDDQSIYQFRGARPENLSDLSKDFPELTVVKLEQNYRSVQRVLRAANAVIASNQRLYEKTLWSALGDGDPIRLLRAADEAAEAELIASEISVRKIRGARYDEFAVLYRSNHQARVIEQALRSRNIPYRITGGRSFFDKAEIKDLIAYLRLLSNPDDDRAFLRVINTPRRELGPATLQKLGAYGAQRHCALFAAASESSRMGLLSGRQGAELSRFCNWMEKLARDAAGLDVLELFDRLVADLDFHDWLRSSTPNRPQAERRVETVNELREWMRRLAKDEKSLDEVVTHLGLIDMLDKADGADDAELVQLATLHASKGLEFPHVVICGMTEGSLPHEQTDDIEEERRLFYVGITRAQRSLTLTAPRHQRRGGEQASTKISRFVGELPADDLERGDDSRSEAQRRENSASRVKGLRALLDG